MHGVRSVRYRPGSADARGLRRRCRSAHSETVSDGSGLSPSRHAWPSSSAPSNAISSAKLGSNFCEFGKVAADMRLYDFLNRVGIRRIKGETRPSVERALAAAREMREAASCSVQIILTVSLTIKSLGTHCAFAPLARAIAESW